MCAKLNSASPALPGECWPFSYGKQNQSWGEKEEAGGCIAVLSALWTGGVEEKPAAFGPSRPATFLQRSLLPPGPPFAAAAAQPGLLGHVGDQGAETVC